MLYQFQFELLLQGVPIGKRPIQNPEPGEHHSHHSGIQKEKGKKKKKKKISQHGAFRKTNSENQPVKNVDTYL